MKKLLVFIHGLNGDGEKSWINSKNKKFGDLLLENEIISSDVDVLYYNYKEHAGIFTGKEIEVNGDVFRGWLTAKSKNYQDIILIAHSMGGLLSKDVILKSELLREKIKLFISLAVPHKGSNWAKLGFSGSTQDLQVFSEVILTQEQAWINEKNLPYTVYIYGHDDKVVNVGSARGLENDLIRKGKYEKYSTYDNHTSISKPESRDANSYMFVENELENILRELNNKSKDSKVELKEVEIDTKKIRETFDSEYLGNLNRKIRIIFKKIRREERIEKQKDHYILAYGKGNEVVRILQSKSEDEFLKFIMIAQNFEVEIEEIACMDIDSLMILQKIKEVFKNKLRSGMDKSIDDLRIDILVNYQVAKWLLFCDLDFEDDAL